MMCRVLMSNEYHLYEYLTCDDEISETKKRNEIKNKVCFTWIFLYPVLFSEFRNIKKKYKIFDWFEVENW